MCPSVWLPVLLGWVKKQLRKKNIGFIRFTNALLLHTAFFNGILATSGYSSPVVFDGNNSNIKQRC
jgi:hypothetical protein